MSLQDVAARIKDAETKIFRLREDAGAKEKQVQIHKFDSCMNYFAFVVDNRYLLLSFFEHNQKGRVESPSVLIRLADYLNVANWLAREMAMLFKVASDAH